MSDEHVTVEWLDGRVETPYGHPSVRDGVLHITEHYGISGDIKGTVSIPLAGLRKWTRGTQS